MAKETDLKKEAMELTANQKADLIFHALETRRNLLSSMDTTHDINSECGYPLTLTADDFQEYYDREGIASRVVDVLPEESWSIPPTIKENDDEADTAFEKRWKEVNKKARILHYAQRIDKLSGIGRYGVLLIGLNDGGALDSPVESVVSETPPSQQRDVLYMRPLPESYVKVAEYDKNTQSPRYGMPEFYTIDFEEFSETSELTTATTVQSGSKVHWSRVVHIADNRGTSDIFGTPRLQKVFNRIFDIRKILSGSGEMFWKGAFPGLAFEMDPEVDVNSIDLAAMREEIENYDTGLQRYLRLLGIKTKSLAPQVEDPTAHVRCNMDVIAITIGCPQRVLYGSEAAKLSSSQDSVTWNRRLSRRQHEYISPMLLGPLLDRLILMGVLPQAEYEIEWTDLNTTSDETKAAIADKLTAALAKYIQGGVSEVIPEYEYIVHVLGFDSKKARTMLGAAIRLHNPDFKDDELDRTKDPGTAGAITIQGA